MVALAQQSMSPNSLSDKAKSADTFNDFPQSLMSVGKTAEDVMVLQYTKTRMSSSHAKVNLFSLVCAMSMVATGYLYCNNEGDGHPEFLQRKQSRSYGKQTVFTISLQRNKQ